MLDGDGVVESKEVPVAGDEAAVDHAQGDLGGRAEDKGGDRGSFHRWAVDWAHQKKEERTLG